MSKKLQEKQRRRLAEEKKRAELRRAQRRRNLVTTLIAIVVLAGVVWLVLSDSSQKGDGGPVGPLANGVSVEEAGCGDVETFEPQEATHIEEGSEHEPYNSNPPTSGPHYAQPLGPIATGFYPSPIEPEKVIHNLEHGEIVIWYNPDAPEQTIDDIEHVVDQVPEATVAVPWDDIEAPHEFALTAWGNLQECAQASEEVIDEFRRDFQGQGPEKIAPPFEG